jgi:hypothetical protein
MNQIDIQIEMKSKHEALPRWVRGPVASNRPRWRLSFARPIQWSPHASASALRTQASLQSKTNERINRTRRWRRRRRRDSSYITSAYPAYPRLASPGCRS